MADSSLVSRFHYPRNNCWTNFAYNWLLVSKVANVAKKMMTRTSKKNQTNKEKQKQTTNETT